MAVDARKLLRTADEILSHPNKWCKGSGRTEGGRVCLFGALAEAAAKLNLDDDMKMLDAAHAMLLNFIPEATDEDAEYGISYGISEFNDAPKTTFKDVKKLIKRTLKG
jgi:hypothetical protein